MRFWVVLLAGVTLATGAMAEQQKAPPGAGDPSARQLSLSRRYVELMQSEQLATAIREVVVAEMNGSNAGADLPAEDREYLIDLSTELAAEMVPQMMDQLAPVYARTFTEEELTAMVEFYDSEIGRSIVDKTYASLVEADQAMMSVMPRLMEKMAARICARYGCEQGEMDAILGTIQGSSVQPRAK